LNLLTKINLKRNIKKREKRIISFSLSFLKKKYMQEFNVDFSNNTIKHILSTSGIFYTREKIVHFLEYEKQDICDIINSEHNTYFSVTTHGPIWINIDTFKRIVHFLNIADEFKYEDLGSIIVVSDNIIIYSDVFSNSGPLSNKYANIVNGLLEVNTLDTCIPIIENLTIKSNRYEGDAFGYNSMLLGDGIPIFLNHLSGRYISDINSEYVFIKNCTDINLIIYEEYPVSKPNNKYYQLNVNGVMTFRRYDDYFETYIVKQHKEQYVNNTHSSMINRCLLF